MKTTAIVCIGDELLDGRVADANARYITESADRLQLQVREIRTVGDDPEMICATLADLSDVELVVVSGGLGPTTDDMTRQAAADFAQTSLVEEPDSVARLKERFNDLGITFTDNNIRQCQFPEGADVLVSEVGTADGFRLQIDGTELLFFPGVPDEFQWFVDRQLEPDEDGGKERGLRRRFTFFGRGESDLETRLGDVPREASRQDVKFGIRADFPIIEIVVAGEPNPTQQLAEDIHRNIGRWIVAEGDETFVQRLGQRLVEADATVTVAESCTAGLLGAKLTEVSGSSRYFEEGYLTYSNGAKTELLGVDKALLQQYGAVSPQVVTQMAAGARRRSNADFSLAISGIAGPTGGTADKPVGTVDFALAAPEGVYRRRVHFKGRSRREVRVLSTHLSCALLLWRLEDRLGQHRFDGPHSYDEVDAGIAVDG